MPHSYKSSWSWTISSLLDNKTILVQDGNHSTVLCTASSVFLREHFAILYMFKKDSRALLTNIKPKRTKNLCESITHIASDFPSLKAFACQLELMCVALLCFACGSISSGWQSKRSSANLFLCLLLMVIDSALSLSVNTMGILCKLLLTYQGVCVWYCS